MEGRTRRQYQAILSIQQTLAAMARYHEYYISRNLAADISRLQIALQQELTRIEDQGKKEEEALKQNPLP